MPKETPEKFAQSYVADQAAMLKETFLDETLFLLAVGQAVRDMLASGQAAVTLDSLLEECIRRRDALGQREKPELNPDWHRLNAAIAHMEILKK